MITVSTKEELNSALRNHEPQITVIGQPAQEIYDKLQRKKRTKRASFLLAAGGIIAAPFTGGLSLAGTVAGLTVGALTISLTELIAILGAGIVLYGIHKKMKIRVEMGPNGPVIVIEPQYD